MTTAIVLSFLLMAACLVIAALLFRRPESLVDAVLAEVHPSAPAGRTSTSASLSADTARKFSLAEGERLMGRGTWESPTAPPSQTRIRLVSKGGAVLGETSVTKRRVSLQQRVGKAQALCNFVASHKEDDVWVYRQVGTERE
jgi:hypothetical protein